jgi:hypothetical protein
MMKKVALLVLKDFYLNRYALLLSFLTVVFFIVVMGYMRPFPAVEQKMMTLVMVNLILNVGYGEWLIYREKAKGTLVTLRLLPVPDSVLIGSKFLMCFFAQTLIFGVAAALLTPEYFLHPKLRTLVLIWLGMGCFGSLMLLTKTVFSQRIGQAVPFGVLFLLLVGFLKISDLYPDGRRVVNELMNSASGVFLLSFAGVGFMLLTWLGSWAWLRSRDSSELID